ncbi:MAG: E3 binding domain-containing protein, partial [Fimbriimonadaceae bacterium]|nr:E3 binding domain-containing protein [Alphaproteobacteria bacterium]
MPIEILMPALSPTMEKGNLAKWLVSEGDQVSSGDVIAEIETDKATMEVEAVEEGKVGKILVPEGSEDVPVNQLIALLLEEGEDASALEGAASGKASQTPAKESAKSDPAPVKETSAAPEATSAAPSPAPVAQNANGGGGRIFASPLARRMASNDGLDLAQLSGSGPKGRIVKRDIEAALKSGGGKAPAKAADASRSGAAPAVQAMPDNQVAAFFEEGSYDVLPHSAMRRIVAERLLESKQTIPHFYLTIDCRLDKLMALRQEINDQAPSDADGKPL